MSDVTCIVSQIESGDPAAAEQFLPLVYDELRKLAAAKLAHEKPGQTLQATALVHEAYLRLVGPAGNQKSEVGGQESPHRPPNSDLRLSTSEQLPLASSPQPLAPLAWHSRGHFFAAAAEAMRRILVESARRKRTRKHGGGLVRHNLDAVQLAARELGEDLLALDEALDLLAKEDPVKAELVKLRHFAGLTVDQAAEALHISPATADRHWAYARAWLHDAIARGAASGSDSHS